MMHGRKMVLVTAEEAERVKSHTETAPHAEINDAGMLALDAEMKKILEMPIKSDFEKWTKYKLVLQRYINKLREMRNKTDEDAEGESYGQAGAAPANPDDVDRAERLRKQAAADIDVYNSLLARSFSSEREQDKARIVINLLKKNQQIEWDSTGKVKINGVENKSSFDDLIRAAIHPKSSEPDGWADFVSILMRMNVPTEYLARRRTKKVKRIGEQNAEKKFNKWQPY